MSGRGFGMGVNSAVSQGSVSNALGAGTYSNQHLIWNGTIWTASQEPAPFILRRDGGQSVGNAVRLDGAWQLDTGRSGKIAKWLDLQSRQDFVQATAGNMPTEGTAKNSRVPVRFTRSNSTRLGGLTLGELIRTGSDYCCWIAFQARAITGTNSTPLGALNDDTIIAGGGYWGIFLWDNGGGAYRITHSTYHTSEHDVSVTGVALNTWYVAEARATGGTAYLRLNNGTEQSVATGVPDDLTGVVSIGGVSGFANSYADIDIGTIIAVPFSPSDSDRAAVRASLIADWT